MLTVSVGCYWPLVAATGIWSMCLPPLMSSPLPECVPPLMCTISALAGAAFRRLTLVQVVVCHVTSVVQLCFQTDTFRVALDGPLWLQCPHQQRGCGLHKLMCRRMAHTIKQVYSSLLFIKIKKSRWVELCRLSIPLCVHIVWVPRPVAGFIWMSLKTELVPWWFTTPHN